MPGQFTREFDPPWLGGAGLDRGGGGGSRKTMNLGPRKDCTRAGEDRSPASSPLQLHRLLFLNNGQQQVEETTAVVSILNVLELDKDLASGFRYVSKGT